jgi:two-component system, OmpR family, response regulator VicR
LSKFTGWHSGYELCKYIRAKSDMPIMFLTALDEEVNIVLGLELGGDDYITKPFRVGVCLSRIKALF